MDHRYSHSAGRASPLKAYLVERNRLFVVAKNFPASMLWRVPFYTVVRYFWHAVALVRGEGSRSKTLRIEGADIDDVAERLEAAAIIGGRKGPSRRR